jgi:uncharacterized membrane protein
MKAIMTEAVLAIALFLISHIVLAENPSRAGLIAILGQRGYVILYSLLSIVLIYWAGSAVERAPVVVLWGGSDILRLLPILVMPVALLLVVCGFTQNNPTSAVAGAVGAAGLMRRDLRGILTVTRNPVMWGLGLWAISHVLASNQVAEMLRFGSFAALAILGSYRIDQKVAVKWGAAAWSDFAARSSNLPFAAILQGRARLDWQTIGWMRPLAVIALYLMLLTLHRQWFGLPAFGH